MDKLPDRYSRPGHEPNDGEPVALPIGYRQPTPLHDLLARMVRDAIQVEKGEEYETEEESNDFNIDDDVDMLLDMSPYILQDAIPEYEAPPEVEPEAPQEKPDDAPESTTVQESAPANGKSPDAQ